MKVDYIEHMGTDLSVVNAARVSFDKESAYTWINQDEDGIPYMSLSQADTKLINYLAKHNHWSPFAHPQVSIRVKAPIFVARQLAKHQVGFAWNEVSRRYVDSEPEFYEPDTWRARAENVKQGSSDEAINLWEVGLDGEPYDPNDWPASLGERLAMERTDAIDTYNMMLRVGVCPEQARMVLPQSLMTTWIWTGSLLGWSRVCKLRLDGHTQKETQEVAQMIEDIVKPLFEVSWEALK
jgi:thymidylate synthase (FAD)